MGRIGQEVARIALGLGMKVVASDLMIDKTNFIRLDFQNNQYIDIEIVTEPFEEVIKKNGLYNASRS